MKYVSILPHFTKNNFKTFEEFYKAPNQTKVSTRSAEEIMRDAEEIMRKVGEKRGIVQAVRTDIGGQQQGE